MTLLCCSKSHKAIAACFACLLLPFKHPSLGFRESPLFQGACHSSIFRWDSANPSCSRVRAVAPYPFVTGCGPLPYPRLVQGEGRCPPPSGFRCLVSSTRWCAGFKTPHLPTRFWFHGRCRSSNNKHDGSSSSQVSRFGFSFSWLKASRQQRRRHQHFISSTPTSPWFLPSRKGKTNQASCPTSHAGCGCFVPPGCFVEPLVAELVPMPSADVPHLRQHGLGLG